MWSDIQISKTVLAGHFNLLCVLTSSMHSPEFCHKFVKFAMDDKRES